VWQPLRHRGRLASHPVERKPIDSGAPEKGGEYLDVQARFRPSDHSASEAIVPIFIGRGAPPFHRSGIKPGALSWVCGRALTGRCLVLSTLYLVKGRRHYAAVSDSNFDPSRS
jgi:hypothetical protein